MNFESEESEPHCPHLCMEGFMQAYILARASSQIDTVETFNQFAKEAKACWDHMQNCLEHDGEPNGGMMMNG